MPGFLSRVLGSDTTEFAKKLADDLSKRLPASLVNDKKRLPSLNRISRVLEDCLAEAVEFKASKKLGVYGKAKMINAFRWRLQELGYNETFLELATEAMTVYVSRKATAAAGSGTQDK